MALLDNFKAFLQSPQAGGLAQGLLQGSARSMTTPPSLGGAFGLGLQHANKAKEEAEKRKLAEKYFGIAQGEYGLKKEEADRAKRLDEFVSQKIEELRGQGQPQGSPRQDEAALGLLDQNPMQQLPGGDEVTQRPEHMTYSVQEPDINGGQLTMIPAMDNGRQMSEQEAKQKYLSQGAPLQKKSGLLEQPPKQAPSGPDIKQLEKAQMALWAGDKKGAVKALTGEEEQNLTGLPQEYNSLIALEKKLGKNHPAVVSAREELELRRENIRSNMKNREEIAKRKDFTALPQSSKNYIMAMGRAMDIAPDEMIKLTNEGKTVSDVAAERGLDINNLTPMYLPTESNVTNQKNRQSLVAELKTVSKDITSAVAPYIQTYGEISPKLVYDQIKNQDPKKVGRYLAGRAIQPELVTLKIASAGGSVNRGMIEGMVHKTLGDAKVFQEFVTPEVYTEMQNQLDDWLDSMLEASTASMYGTEKKAEANADAEYARKRAATAKKYGITEEEVDKRLGRSK